MAQPGMTLYNLKITGDQVEATFIDKQEYLRQLNNEMERLKRQRDAYEKDLIQRAQASRFSAAERDAKMYADIKAMEDAYRKKVQELIRESTEKARAKNLVDQQFIQEIRRKNEEVERDHQVYMQKLEAQHLEVMQKYEDEQRRIAREQEENGRRHAAEREKWDREKAAMQREAQRKGEEMAAEFSRREEEKLRETHQKLAAHRQEQEREEERAEAEHQRRMHELQEKMRQVQETQETWEDPRSSSGYWADPSQEYGYPSQSEQWAGDYQSAHATYPYAAQPYMPPSQPQSEGFAYKSPVDHGIETETWSGVSETQHWPTSTSSGYPAQQANVHYPGICDYERGSNPLTSGSATGNSIEEKLRKKAEQHQERLARLKKNDTGKSKTASRVVSET